MKIDYKSLFLGVALGVVGVFSTLFLLGDVKTEFSVKIGEHANKMDKNIDVRIEKTIKNGQDFTNIVVKGSGDFTKDDFKIFNPLSLSLGFMLIFLFLEKSLINRFLGGIFIIIYLIFLYINFL